MGLYIQYSDVNGEYSDQGQAHTTLMLCELYNSASRGLLYSIQCKPIRIDLIQAFQNEDYLPHYIQVVSSRHIAHLTFLTLLT